MDREILYFAWLREKVGTGRETVASDAATVADLIAELGTRGEGHALAFADTRAIRCALDQRLVELDAPLGPAREVAFFPPMTGG